MKNYDIAASKYKYIVKNKMEKNYTVIISQKSCNITDLNPATSYIFSKTPEIVNGTFREPMDINVTAGGLTSSQDDQEPFIPYCHVS